MIQIIILLVLVIIGIVLMKKSSAINEYSVFGPVLSLKEADEEMLKFFSHVNCSSIMPVKELDIILGANGRYCAVYKDSEGHRTWYLDKVGRIPSNSNWVKLLESELNKEIK